MASALAVVVAWNFAVAQPLLDVLGRNAPFFVVHGSRPVDIAVLVVGLTVVAPSAVAGVLTLLEHLNHTVGRSMQRIVLGALLVIFARQLVDRIALPPGAVGGGLAVAGSAVLAGGALYAWERLVVARMFVRWLTPAPFVFLSLFLFASPSGRLVLPSSAGAAEAVRIGNPVPVVMVVFDELPSASLMTPDGAVDGRAYPNFARLSRTSTWYRNTTTVDTFTVTAVPALLDGRQPDRLRLPTVAEHPRNLFSLVAGRYDIDAYEPMTLLCPTSECGAVDEDSWWDRVAPMLSDVRAIAAHVLLPRPMARSFPAVDGRWADFANSLGSGSPGLPTVDPIVHAKGLQVAPGPARRRELASHSPGAAAAAFAAGLTPAPRPGLHFLHVKLPHSPWWFLPDGRRYEKTKAPFTNWGEWPSQAAADQGRSRHLLQTRYADLLLGVILDRMADTGLLREAMVVVTADHGIGFRRGSAWRGVDASVMGETAWVPLFIKRPGQTEGAVDDRPASTIDVLPTVASVLEMPLPDVDGRSLLGEPWAHRRRVVSAGDGKLGPPTAIPSRSDRRDEAVRRAWATYGTGPDDSHRLFRLGPYGRLVGRRVPSPAVRDLTRRVEVYDLNHFEEADPNGSDLPALVSGRVIYPRSVARSPDVTQLVVAVNGIVAGTSWVADVSGVRGAFTALLDPSAFHRGRNAVAVYAATGPASRPVLRLLPAP